METPFPFQTYDTIPDPIGPCKVSVSLKPAVEGREIMSSRIRNLESQNNILQTRIDITFNTAELAAFHITAVSWGECVGLTDASQEKRLGGPVPSSGFPSTLEIHPSHCWSHSALCHSDLRALLLFVSDQGPSQ